MNLYCRLVLPLVFCGVVVYLPFGHAAAQPDLAELTESPVTKKPVLDLSSPAERFNALNSLVRDGKIGRVAARSELKRLLAELRGEYYRKGGIDFLKDTWVFPLAGYDARAMGGGRNKGYIASGYDFFSGNRHGGHPSFDIFIHDRNQDCLDDRSGKPVRVLSLTGGIVVALEREWQQGSGLRGGKYIWIFDPTNDLLVYYAHNSELFVKLGEIIKPGDQLAIVGRSGYNAEKRRSPSHLHLTVLRVRDGLPLPVNVYRELAKAGTGTER
ncbi:MAG: M23 family metallopeptidase [Desulfuromonadales bacterium]|nr:M23 family metallopeptidase [Desulfuromonadales bacterium]